MSVAVFLLLAALSGLIIGALARLLLPGRDPMTILETMLVGVAGTMLAALVAYYVFDEDRGPGFLLSLLFAIAIVFVVRKWRERRAGETAPGIGPTRERRL